MDLEDVHTCEDSEGKMVMIEVNPDTGETFCGYCGEKVDYSEFFDQKMDELDIDVEQKRQNVQKE